jgi:hypothetical protein
MLDPIGGAPSAVFHSLVPTLPPPRPVPGTQVPAGQPLAPSVQGTQPRHALDVLFAKMANASYTDKPKPDDDSENDLQAADWTRLQDDGHVMRTSTGQQVDIDPAMLHDKSSGFQSEIYTDGNGHYVVAYAGTDPHSLGDVKNDLEQGTGMASKQYDEAVALGRKVDAIAGHGNVAFTGHSLGGGLAATAAVATGEKGVTFNAAGVSNETLRRIGIENPNDLRAQLQTNGQLRSYSVDGDPMTTVDENGAPEQLGARWHVPWDNPDGKLSNPMSLADTHGGSGNGAPYVEALEHGTPEPGIVQNPWGDGALDSVFDSASPAFAVVQARSAVIGEVGNVGTLGRGVLGDFVQIGGRDGHEIANIAQHPDAMALLRGDGAIDKGVLQSGGAVADRLDEFGGRTVTTVTDNLGSGIRSLDLGGVGNGAARGVEYTGDVVRDGFDFTGKATRGTLDALGSASDWTQNRIADAGDAVVHAVNPMNWF